MTEKNKYRIINIRRYIGNENPELGEDELLQILSEFSYARIKAVDGKR